MSCHFPSTMPKAGSTNHIKVQSITDKEASFPADFFPLINKAYLLLIIFLMLMILLTVNMVPYLGNISDIINRSFCFNIGISSLCFYINP